jgi:uncharacterized protein YacL
MRQDAVRTEKCPTDQSLSIKQMAKALVTFDASLLTTCPKSDEETSTDVAPAKQNSLQKREFVDTLRKVGIVVGLIILAPVLLALAFLALSLVVTLAPIWIPVLLIYYLYTYIENKTANCLGSGHASFTSIKQSVRFLLCIVNLSSQVFFALARSEGCSSLQIRHTRICTVRVQ